MRASKRFVPLATLCLGLLAAMLPQESLAARLALVVGNNAYKYVTPLRNATADARAVANALRQNGFEVALHTDVDDRGLKQALRGFKSKINGGDEVVFYFSGHGVQLANSNYLLPVDIRGESEDQVRDEALPLQRVLEDFQDQKARFTIAIVDACRNNPFRGQGRALGGKGLAPTSPASGQMVMYAAGAGQQALDTLGDKDRDPNGVFTRVLLKEMARAGVPADRLLKSVREQVIAMARSVNHEQVPAIYDQSVGEFFFVPGRAAASVTPRQEEPSVERDRFEAAPEEAAWRAAQAANTAPVYEAFLQVYPSGRFSPAARIALLALRQQQPAASANDKLSAAREQAAREQAAREQAAREQAAREQAARQQAARDQAAREQAAREQAAREQAAREQAARDQAAREQAAREETKKEQAARVAREQAAREQAAREQAAREQAARDEAARQQAARDEAARQQAAREEAARQQAAREQATVIAMARPQSPSSEQAAAAVNNFKFKVGERFAYTEYEPTNDMVLRRATMTVSAVRDNGVEFEAGTLVYDGDGNWQKGPGLRTFGVFKRGASKGQSWDARLQSEDGKASAKVTVKHLGDENYALGSRQMRAVRLEIKGYANGRMTGVTATDLVGNSYISGEIVVDAETGLILRTQTVTKIEGLSIKRVMQARTEP